MLQQTPYFLMLVLVASVASEDTCVALTDCPTLDVLDKQGEEMGFSRRQILRQLREASCGHYLYRCPAPEVVQGELLIEVDSGGRFSALRHTPTVSDCIGTIQIFTKSRSRISRITLPGNANANFFKRSTMDNANSSLGQIVLVRTFGNCCWTIFERESRKGNKIHLEMGRQWRPSFQPAAFLKYEC